MKAGLPCPRPMNSGCCKWGFVPDLGVWRSNSLPDAERVQEQLAIKEKALVELLGQDNWRCAVAVFKSLDVISHQRYSANLDGPVAKLLVDLDQDPGKSDPSRRAQHRCAGGQRPRLSPLPTDA